MFPFCNVAQAGSGRNLADYLERLSECSQALCINYAHLSCEALQTSQWASLDNAWRASGCKDMGPAPAGLQQHQMKRRFDLLMDCPWGNPFSTTTNTQLTYLSRTQAMAQTNWHTDTTHRKPHSNNKFNTCPPTHPNNQHTNKQPTKETHTHKPYIHPNTHAHTYTCSPTHIHTWSMHTFGLTLPNIWQNGVNIPGVLSGAWQHSCNSQPNWSLGSKMTPDFFHGHIFCQMGGTYL